MSNSIFLTKIMPLKIMNNKCRHLYICTLPYVVHRRSLELHSTIEFYSDQWPYSTAIVTVHMYTKVTVSIYVFSDCTVVLYTLVLTFTVQLYSTLSTLFSRIQLLIIMKSNDNVHIFYWYYGSILSCKNPGGGGSYSCRIGNYRYDC